MILHLKTVEISSGREKDVAKDDEFNGRKSEAGDSRYAEAISKLERELAEKGLSRDEIKSLEEVIYGQADEILEEPTSGTGGAVAGGTPDAGIPPRRDTDFLDDISREMRGNLFSKGREETDMEKPTLKEGERIYDLTDVIEETPPGGDRGEGRVAQTPSMKDRLAGETPDEIRVSQEKKVYELSNLFDESQEGLIREEVRRKAAEVAEKVAREVMPGIVERVIREEIEKLKKT
jgi:hypothetical protein